MNDNDNLLTHERLLSTLGFAPAARPCRCVIGSFGHELRPTPRGLETVPVLLCPECDLVLFGVARPGYAAPEAFRYSSAVLTTRRRPGGGSRP